MGKALRSMAISPEVRLPPFDPESKLLNAIIETPKGSRNKYCFDPERGLYCLKSVLPEGDYFPYDFGFVPSTLADDGDPLDVLVLMDEPAAVGLLVPARLLGVIEAIQQKGDKAPERNDRLIAIAAASRGHDGVERLKDLPDKCLKDIEQFFISYSAGLGKKFVVKRHRGRKHAAALVSAGEHRAKK